MDGRRHVVLGLVVSSLLALLLTWAVTIEVGWLIRFDEAVSQFTRSWAQAWGWPVTAAHELALRTGVVFSSFIAALLCLFLMVRRRWGAAAFLAACAVGGAAITVVMKLWVSRTRPPGAEQYEAILTDSFPSGHTMVGIYLYLAAGLVVLRIGQANDRRWMVALGRLLIVFGALLGPTRVVVGAHWASDVIGGWAFGSAVVCAAALALWRVLDSGWPTQRSLPNNPDPASPSPSAQTLPDASHSVPDTRPS